MEFLQKNARAIIIALLAAGVVVAISASGDNNNEETANQESSEVASNDANTDGPLAPDANEEATPVESEESAEESSAEDENEEATPVPDDETTNDENDDATNDESATGSEDDNDETADTATSEQVSGDVVRDEDNYSVSASFGDNQTILMRKLIAQYESENDVELTAPQRLYAETNLVNDLGRANFIPVGTTIALSGADIKERVEEARILDEPTLALWEQYL